MLYVVSHLILTKTGENFLIVVSTLFKLWKLVQIMAFNFFLTAATRGFIVAHSLRVQAVMIGKAVGHTVSTLRKRWDMNTNAELAFSLASGWDSSPRKDATGARLWSSRVN